VIIARIDTTPDQPVTDHQLQEIHRGGRPITNKDSLVQPGMVGKHHKIPFLKYFDVFCVLFVAEDQHPSRMPLTAHEYEVLHPRVGEEETLPVWSCGFHQFCAKQDRLDELLNVSIQ
jgi:hypothetical protein